MAKCRICRSSLQDVQTLHLLRRHPQHQHGLRAFVLHLHGDHTLVRPHRDLRQHPAGRLARTRCCLALLHG